MPGLALHTYRNGCLAGLGFFCKGVEKMKAHRVTQCSAIDNTDKPHTFIEVEPDRWLEIDTDALDEITHQTIHHHLEKEQDAQEFDLRMCSQYFRIHNTQLTELKPIG